MSKPDPCPFCGSNPHRGPMKAERCQLHGETVQRFRVWRPRGCAQQTGTSPLFAIQAWNRRYVAQEPA